MKSEKEPKGYLTVFLSLIMLVLLPLSMALIESVRQKAAKLEAAISADVAMNSIMAEYQRDLLTQYHLFFVDVSYGKGQPSYDKISSHLEGFAKGNLANDSEGLLGFSYVDFLGMSLENVHVDWVNLATDYDGRVFQREAIEAIKSDYGLEAAEKIVSYFEKANETSLYEKDIEAQIDENRRQLEEARNKKDESKEEEDKEEKEASKEEPKIKDREEWKNIDMSDPVKEVWTQRSKGILPLVLGDTSSVSQTTVDLEQLVSYREKHGNINHGNGPEPKGLNILDKALLYLYFMKYSGNYVSPREDSILTYETEYLLAGKESDMDNLKSAVNMIMGFREAANCYTLSKDRIKMKEIELLGLGCSLFILAPQTAPLFQSAIFLGWSFMESAYDVKQLLSGEKVPLIKKGREWHYSLLGMIGGLLEGNQKHTGGLEYTDYLILLLMVGDDKKQTFRFMDLIELNLRKNCGKNDFRMDGCAHGIGATLRYKSSFGYEFYTSQKRDYEDY